MFKNVCVRDSCVPSNLKIHTHTHSRSYSHIIYLICICIICIMNINSRGSNNNIVRRRSSVSHIYLIYTRVCACAFMPRLPRTVLPNCFVQTKYFIPGQTFLFFFFFYTRHKFCWRVRVFYHRDTAIFIPLRAACTHTSPRVHRIRV